MVKRLLSEWQGKFPDGLRARGGQAMSETVILLPLFFFIVFALLQLAHMGLAVLMVNYAASSIARQAASDNNIGPSTGDPNAAIVSYWDKAGKLMVAGIHLDTYGLKGCVSQADASVPTGELVVRVRATMPAWPFVGYLLNGLFGDRYAAQALDCGNAQSSGGFGPFNYSSQPPTFYITGTGKVRLNYRV